jgi:hypothetical protein
MFKPFIFVSYAHEDSRWFEKASLMTRIIPSLEKRENAEVWYDKGRIGGADIWREEIDNAIDRANIAILLVSQYFLNSDFIMHVELPRLVKRAEEMQLVLFPILVGYCDWESIEALSRPQMMPGEPTPLVEYLEPLAKWERVQYEILQALRRQIDKLRKERKGPEPVPQAKPELPRPARVPQLRNRLGWFGGLSNFLRPEQKKGILSEGTLDTAGDAPDAAQALGDPWAGAKTQTTVGQALVPQKTKRDPGPGTAIPEQATSLVPPAISPLDTPSALVTQTSGQTQHPQNPPPITVGMLTQVVAPFESMPPPPIVEPATDSAFWGHAGPRFGTARVAGIRPGPGGVLAASTPRFGAGTLRCISCVENFAGDSPRLEAAAVRSVRVQQAVLEGGQPTFGTACVRVHH